MPGVDEGWSIIIAALLAIAGIFYTSRQNRQALRKQHTYQVLDKMNDWPLFEENYEHARKLITSRTVPKMCNEADRVHCEKIDFLLNFYEFISSAVVSGDIDEELVRRIEEERLPRLYLKLLAYVDENRTAMSDRIWQNVEHVCYRWTVARPTMRDKLIERWWMRPNPALFDANRAAVKATLQAYAATLK